MGIFTEWPLRLKAKLDLLRSGCHCSLESIPCRPKTKCDVLLWRPNTKETTIAILCVAFIVLPCVALTYTPGTFRPLYGSGLTLRLRSFLGFGGFAPQRHEGKPASLENILEKASMPNKTVIITTLNGAWAENNSMIDFFLESFHHGDGTEGLLNHLIIVALDQKAYDRCLDIHQYCYKLKTVGVDFSGEKTFMSDDYLKMMWRRILFLRKVLEKGYSFVFSDADVLWFRNPFPHFLPDRDFQIACDQFFGNPTDLRNRPNGGFVFVRANNQTVKFYKYWYNSQKLHPNHHDQDVLNDIKFEKNFSDIGMRIRFLDTQFFGGFCAIWRSNLDKVTTMHANCCKGLKAKLQDLESILQDWYQYRSNNTEVPHRLAFRSPVACPKSWN
eukprot:c25156_g1_i1 orf=1531-2688(+)